MNALKWKQDGYLYFAHSEIGMWMIEQKRGRFILTLSLKSVRGAGGEQDFGHHASLAKAKAEAARGERALGKLDQ